AELDPASPPAPLGDAELSVEAAPSTASPVPAARETSAAPKLQIPRWADVMNWLSLFVYLYLPVPQILRSYHNLHSGAADQLQVLSPLGYSFGMLADLLVIPYFLSINEKAPASVQVVGVLANSVVLYQITAAHFLPALAVTGIYAWIGISLFWIALSLL